jgi:hypothetical protein
VCRTFATSCSSGGNSVRLEPWCCNVICVQHTRDFLLCRCLLDLTLLEPSRNQTVTECVITTVCACACPLVHVPLCVHKLPDQVSNRHMTSRLTMHVYTRPQHNVLNGDRFKAVVVVLSSLLCVVVVVGVVGVGVVGGVVVSQSARQLTPRIGELARRVFATHAVAA